MCETCEHGHLTERRAIGRRDALTLGFGMAATLLAPTSAFAADENPPPKPQNVISPEQALDRLIDGNGRYVNGLAKRHDFLAEREALVGGQNPYAGILSCADSRIAPELAFDSSRGDLFVVRVAGNFVTADGLASFEFAVDALKTPLLFVLGHEACGAIKAAISSIQDKITLPGHLPSLVAGLAPAVDAAANEPGDPVVNVTRENVRRNVETLKTAGPIISAAVDSGQVKVVGGIYRLATGQVELVG